MKNWNLISMIVFIVTVLGAMVLYVLVFNHFDKIWNNWDAMFYLCFITFGAAICIYCSAIMLEKKQ